MNDSLIPSNLFGEQYADDIALVFKPKKILVSQKTKYQQVDIIDTESYGKVLFLDNLLMKTDRDGHIITEMIVHVPMLSGGVKKRVLVIGGGEGFTASMLSNFDEIETIDVVDIDEEFVNIAKEFYPEKTSIFDDSKVSLFTKDGLKFLKETKEMYDAIFVTVTDPSSISKSLFSDEFYKLCAEKLNKNGIFMTDAYMPFYDFGETDYLYMNNLVSKYFSITKLYTCTVPSFPGGLFAFVIGSNGIDPESDIRTLDLKHKTKYYNKELHSACFKLPQFMLDRLD